MLRLADTLLQQQEAQYNLLLSLQSELLSFMKDGIAARDVYLRAVDFIRERKPDLEKHFVKTVGFGVSLSDWIQLHALTVLCRWEWSSEMPLMFYLPRTLVNSRRT